MDGANTGPRGRTLALGALVLLGGFAVMVLEIVGARYLQPWFGGAFYVWTSQIGMVMLALALGYGVGGHLADRFKKARFLSLLLAPAGIFILLIPQMAPGVLNSIVDRHENAAAPKEASAEPVITETNLLSELPKDFLEGNTNNAANALPAPPVDDAAPSEIPALWRKLDPAIGSAVVFLFPCFVLAMISPFMVRLAARQVAHVGTVSGLVYAASTVGSIAGVFISAYVLIDLFTTTQIFQLTGALTLGLGGLCCLIDWQWPEELQDE
ncbi:MAG: fused MFS/spermidine synthase [Verrucomicrobia subdivision 3 bacterium]|nr:fused MFS/spermidine synthase [Limisphaerales bacterium]